MATGVNGKKHKIEDMPLCQYGTACYQKNSDHLQHYHHPSPKPPAKKNGVKEVKGKTPNKKIKANAPQTSSSSQEWNKIMKEKFLVEMPDDFYDFWQFCCAIEPNNTQGVFSELGLNLVGPFDILSEKLSDELKPNDYLCHWRYYYDPPEFQTLVVKDGEDLLHIGYFRDDPKEMPSIVASNNAASGAKLSLMGDNIFAAMSSEVKKSIGKANKSLKVKFTKVLEDMQKVAKSKKYSLETKTSKTKARDKKIVTKSFHGLGIVVPVDKKNDVGYRPLPDSDAVLLKMLKRISAAKSDEERMKGLDVLQEVVTNVIFANDECDFGMGLELGMDLFCYGDSCLHKEIHFLLPLAYELLKRPQFAQIIKAHLQNRRKGRDLSADS